MVANHAFGFTTREFPNRKVTAFIVLPEESSDISTGALLVNDGEKRMIGTVGVPEWENRVLLVFEVLKLVYLVVSAAIASIDVAHEVGRNHGMIQSGVENSAGLLIGIHIYFLKFLLPLLLIFLINARYWKVRNFGVEVEFSTCGIDMRHPNLDKQLFGFYREFQEQFEFAILID